jgi:hypothetical protein
MVDIAKINIYHRSYIAQKYKINNSLRKRLHIIYGKFIGKTTDNDKIQPIFALSNGANILSNHS